MRPRGQDDANVFAGGLPDLLPGFLQAGGHNDGFGLFLCGPEDLRGRCDENDSARFRRLGGHFPRQTVKEGRFPPRAHDGDRGLWRNVKGFEKIHDVKTLGDILKTVPQTPSKTFVSR